ncbi:MAG: hypothetical protein R3B06_17900 [Kofleriaceae bacterium]
MRRSLSVIVVVGLATTGLVPACSGPGTAPTAALDRYAAALRNKNYDAAYGLMSSEFRAKVGRDEFVRLLRDNPREVADTAARLDGRKRSVQVTAELVYGLGDTLSLIEEGGRWRIAENPLAFYDQSSPRAALRSFIRAYRLERWDVMLRFVPKDYAAAMSVDMVKAQFTGERKEAMALLLTALEANVDQPIDEVGPGEARLRYGAGQEVVFIREEGRWRLRDLE